MELLLALLSLLTAATGALTGARAPEAELQQPAQVGVVTVASASAAIAVQVMAAPARAILGGAPSSAAPSGRAFAIASAAPLYADRLIE